MDQCMNPRARALPAATYSQKGRLYPLKTGVLELVVPLEVDLRFGWSRQAAATSSTATAPGTRRVR
jgi:hypothetical protein